jgi:CheY-like chemotaxis protein
MTGPTVAVVADDLIWAERLRGLATASGAVVTMCRSARDLEDALTDVDAVIVDLSTRSFDPQVAIGRASQASRPVLAVGPHDADAVRARARASGADRVLAYRALAEAGPDAIERWLERVGVRGSGQAAASGADRVPAEEPVGG